MRTQKIEHLKTNGGRYYYRRRVPKQHQKTLGVENWNRPCGKVSYQQAVVLVTEWAAEHDKLLARLDDPIVAEKTRYKTEVRHLEAPMMQVADTMTDIGMVPGNWRGDVMLSAAKVALQAADEHPEKSSAARLVGYRSIYALCFNEEVIPPTNLDERDEFDLVKRKLERRITELGGNPNTITAMSEAYFKKNQLKPEVRNKYRRVIKRLIAQVGDMPLDHLNADRLREFRDAQPDQNKASAIQSLFTPIRGMFKYAIGEGKISENPMPSVVLKREKRSIQMIKWKPFSPAEVRRIFAAMDEVWGSPLRGMADERRLAIHMVCRVQAFTAMRRAILGHKLAGSLAHYDDGPEFFKKRKWIRASDPRIDYPDPGEDDDLD